MSRRKPLIEKGIARCYCGNTAYYANESRHDLEKWLASELKRCPTLRRTIGEVILARVTEAMHDYSTDNSKFMGILERLGPGKLRRRGLA